MSTVGDLGAHYRDAVAGWGQGAVASYGGDILRQERKRNRTLVRYTWIIVMRRITKVNACIRRCVVVCHS